jgi:hypothetical protein
MMEVLTPSARKTSTCPTTSTASATPLVTPPDLDRFARLDSLGLIVTGQQIFPDHGCCSARSRFPMTGVLAAASRGDGMTR